MEWNQELDMYEDVATGDLYVEVDGELVCVSGC